jgi:hypothetical protein
MNVSMSSDRNKSLERLVDVKVLCDFMSKIIPALAALQVVPSTAFV